MRLGDWTPTWTCPVPIQHCCITCPHQATLAAVIVISAWQLQVLLLCCFSRRRDGWCMHPQSNMLSAATAVEYQWQLVQLQSQASSWAAWYNTRLLIESTPKGVVFSFLFFSFLFFSQASCCLPSGDLDLEAAQASNKGSKSCQCLFATASNSH